MPEIAVRGLAHGRLLAWLALGTLIFAPLAFADEALDWLNRAAAAARQLNYGGVYVYHHGEHVEVMRVAHRRDAAGELERIEVLDDTPRQFLRVNNDVYCHLADGKTVRVERNASRRFFPAILPEKPEALTAFYDVKLGGSERVAGHSCQVVVLEPRDGYRHAFELWLDKRTALPLKSRIINANGAVVSMFVFSEVQIGRAPDAALFRPELAGKKVQLSGVAQPAAAAWEVTPPPGYARVLEAARPMPGKKAPVTHLVYSDGLNVMSLFIEPADGRQDSLVGLAAEGAIGVYAREIDGFRVTTLGEVPNAALIETGNSVRLKR